MSCCPPASPPGALLLPKLRSQFAEFLREPSPIGLSTLAPVVQCRIHTICGRGLFLARAACPRAGARSLGDRVGVERSPVPRARSSPDVPSDERVRVISLGIGSPTTEFSCRGTLRLAAAPNCTVLYVTHTCIVTSDRRSTSHDVGRALRTSPLLRGVCHATAANSVEDFNLAHCRRKGRRSVSCYALLKRWLLPSLRSDGRPTLTSFVILSPLSETLFVRLGCFPLVAGP